MRDALIRWGLTMLAVAVAAWIVPGLDFETLGALAVAALVLGVLNMFLKPLLALFTLPLVLLSLGLFMLVINAFLLWLTGKIVPGFYVAGFWPAFFGGLIISLVNLFAGKNTRAEARGSKRGPRLPPKGPPPGKGPVIDV